MTGKNADERGFTFLECMIAVFMIGLTASAFAVVLQMSSKTQAMAAMYQQATSLAQHKIDQLRAVGYGRLNYPELSAGGIIDKSQKDLPFLFTSVDNLAAISPSCAGTVDVADYSYNVRQVTVNVTWKTGPTQRLDGNVTLTALITKQ